MDYQLLDSGDQKRLEQFGSIKLVRPCSQAIWKTTLKKAVWTSADAEFSRSDENIWDQRKSIPDNWVISVNDLKFKVAPTPFGHIGVFPEHMSMWDFLEKSLASADNQSVKILNLFAYTGATTLFLAKKGASVCHVDASKAAALWAGENAKLNKLHNSNIRWIVDDAMKFLKREVKRGSCYQGILLDPPSFGRGTRKEVFKIEEHLVELLDLCVSVLDTKKPLFFLLTCHTEGITPLGLCHLLKASLCKHPVVKESLARVDAAEMKIDSKEGRSIPSGCYARWGL